MPSLQSVGTSCFCHTVLNRFARRGVIDSACFSNSGWMWSEPAALPFFSFLIARVTSSSVIGSRLMSRSGMSRESPSKSCDISGSGQFSTDQKKCSSIAAFVDHVLLHVFRPCSLLVVGQYYFLRAPLQSDKRDKRNKIAGTDDIHE